MTAVLPKRSEVPKEVTWSIETVFPSDTEWEATLKATQEATPAIEKYRGKVGSSAALLLEALTAREKLIMEAERCQIYAGMQSTSDITNQTYLAHNDQADSLSARVQSSVSYFEPEILAIDPSRLKAMLSEEPGLELYSHYFDKLNSQRAHIRSAEVEEVLAAASEVTSSPYRIHIALEDADLKFATVKDEEGQDVDLQQGNVWPLIRSQKRAVRKAAWEAYADGYISVKNTMAGTMSGIVKRDVFYATARGYSSSLEAALGAINIPMQVYTSLLDTYRKHIPVWHRYWEIKRRALGVDKLHGYDIDMPLVRTLRHIPYEEGKNIVIKGMQPLGEDYGSTLRRGLNEERWVDIYPNVGKGSGAFSYGMHGQHPFLMMNYDDSLESVSTLAHELGHSMHSYFSWQSHPHIYSRYSMFVAETASNFNQAMVRADLLKQGPDIDFELEILAEAMSNFHRYFFIMPALARFELDCHQRVERGEGLTADGMSRAMSDLFREAYGPSVEVDEARVGITWAQFPHLFANFYVFQYATGISAANALASGIISGGESKARSYMEFLKAGDALYPLDALKLAGIDMTTPEPVERAFGVLSGMVDRLETIVGLGPLVSGESAM
ncbi:MAG: oligoendopeptidase F [Chloroflexota bacterium]|nr:oligoendopeptidase F [Chloroflexota bacterium]